MKASKEYEAFEHLTRKLMAVPHAKIKEKLDEEKRAKEAKKKAKAQK